MSHALLEKLEVKIENAIELIELLRLQIEELEEKNQQAYHENTALKQHQAQWEKSLTALLRKLDSAHLHSDKVNDRYEDSQEEHSELELESAEV